MPSERKVNMDSKKEITHLSSEERRIILLRSPNITVSDILSSLQDMKMLKRRDMFFPAYTRSSLTDILHDI